MVKNALVRSLVAAGAFAAFALPAQAETVNLESLKARCHENANNKQIREFNSSFTCSEERTVLMYRGEQKFELTNETTVRVKALIKDDRHQSAWWEVPGTAVPKYGFCPVYEQVKLTARTSVNINSCAELDLIVSEKQFCADRLAGVWASCDADLKQAQKAGQSLPEASRCEIEATGVVRSCLGDAPVQQADPAQQAQQSCEQSGTKGGKDQGCSQQAGRNQGSAAQGATEDEYGAALLEVPVRRSFWHQNHRVVQVASPVKGGLLSKLGLRQGDVVSRIDGSRTRDVATFKLLLKQAKAKGRIELEYRDARGEFTETTLRF